MAQAEAYAPRWGIRVIDPVSGLVVVDRLYHSSAKYEAKGMQPGAPGSVAVGTFQVDLPEPGSDMYAMSQDQLTRLKVAQRVEIYAGEPSGGDPVFTGIIRSTPVELSKYAIRGVDSLQILQQAKTARTEYFSNTTDQLAALALRADTLLQGDDFTGTTPLNSYLQVGGTAWSIAADEGLTTAQQTNSANAEQLLLYNSNFAAANYSDCKVRCYWHVVAATTATNLTSFGVVAASDSAGNNLVAARVEMKAVSSTEWDVDVVLEAKVSGSYAASTVNSNAGLVSGTWRVRKTLVFNVPSSQFRCQVQLLGKKGTYSAGTGAFTPSPTGADYLWRVLVNGVDANVYAILQANAPAGYFGAKWQSQAGGTPQGFANRLVFRNRQNAFQQGSFTVGTKTISQYFSRTPLVDLLTIAAQTEGWVWRKRPKAGLGNDVIDFGPQSIVNDYSNTYVFREGRDLTQLQVEQNAEPPASEVELQLSPGSDNAGFIEWDNPTAERTYGILTNSVVAQNISDFLAGRSLADQLLALGANPGFSKKFSVALDPDWAYKVFPLDYVGLDAPVRGLQMRKVQVIALSYEEGKGEAQITGDSYPIGDIQIARLAAETERIAAGVGRLSPTTGTATVYDNNYGVPNVMTCYSGYWPVDATHNLQLPFTFPRNLAMIQRVTLSFFLFAYLQAMNATTGSTTSSGGSSHSHTVSNHTHSFSIGLENNGGASFSVLWDNVNKLFALSGASDTYTNAATGSGGGQTSSADTSHTHTVPSASLNSPTSLQSGVGGATGVHVIIDGTDQTTNLGGPWSSNQVEINITPYVIGGGQHTIQLSSTALGGISAQMQAFVQVKSI